MNKFVLEGIEIHLAKSALEVWKENIEFFLQNAPPLVDDSIEPVYEEAKRSTLKLIEKLIERMNK